MDDSTRTELEAAAFRRLVSHLRGRNDVQNIDMMNLAGFCRNCLSRWYREEAAGKGVEMDDAAAREIVYGMDYAEWKANTRPRQRPNNAPPTRKATPTADRVRTHNNRPA